MYAFGRCRATGVRVAVCIYPDTAHGGHAQQSTVAPRGPVPRGATGRTGRRPRARVGGARRAATADVPPGAGWIRVPRAARRAACAAGLIRMYDTLIDTYDTIFS